MFKNRHIQVKLVKDNQASPESVPTPIEIPEEAISRVMRDTVHRIAIGAIAVIGAAVVLTSAGQIAVNSIDNHQKNNQN